MVFPERKHICPMHEWQSDTENHQETHRYYEREESVLVVMSQPYSMLCQSRLVIAKSDCTCRFWLIEIYWTSAHILVQNSAAWLPTGYGHTQLSIHAYICRLSWRNLYIWFCMYMTYMAHVGSVCSYTRVYMVQIYHTRVYVYGIYVVQAYPGSKMYNCYR